MSIAIVLCLATVFLSAFATGRVRAYAIRHSIFDNPNERSSHFVATPRGGGAGILFGGFVGNSIAAAFGFADAPVAIILGLGALILAFVGWRDDRQSLSPAIRLAAQAIVAVGSVVALGGLPAIRIANWTLTLGSTGILIGSIGVIWSINLFNFMDGIDGLAGSQSCLILTALGTMLFAAHQPALAILAMVIASACLGFLFWNWPPAKIFMGDVASGTLGYLVAALAIVSENRHAVPLTASLIVSGFFFGDATVTLIRRLWRRRPPAQAHRDHAYQRLTRAWGSHIRVSQLAAMLTLVLAIMAFAAARSAVLSTPALAVSICLLAAVFLLIEKRMPM